jgi:hypothetical protein
MIITKICSICGINKELGEYNKRIGVADGRVSECKECSRKRQKKNYVKNLGYYQDRNKKQTAKIYGITVEEYDSMLERQGGVCEICGQGERSVGRTSGKIYNLAVDHDHTTGKIRGLLCSTCNKSAYVRDDDIENAERLVLYLKKYKTEKP